MDELIGQAIDEYQIIDFIISGAKSRIYLATQPVLERHVAIKIPHFRYDEDGKQVKRVSRTMTSSLLAEAKILSRLEHPNVIPIHDSGVGEMHVTDRVLNVPYYAMRYVSGGNLDQRVKGGDLTASDVIAIAENLADALDYMHRKDIIHRDLKPRDILFDEFNIPYVGNFGVAYLEGVTVEEDGRRHLGTPVVVAPEVWQGEEHSRASDIYSFGCTIFFALTGQFPFPEHEHKGREAMAEAHIHHAAPKVTELRPELPPLLNTVFERVLAKAPAERYPTAVAFAQALKDAYRYEGRSKHIFVSYTRRDQHTVTEVVQSLRAMGHTPWYDRELLQTGGQHWWDNILDNIRSCDAVLYLLSRQSLESLPCQLEVNYARALNRRIVPILIDPELDRRMVPAWLAALQDIDLTVADGELALRVSLDRLPPTAPLPDPLPPEPDVPVSELSQLAERINLGDMESDDQLLTITKLELMLDDPDQADGALQLLKKLSARHDISATAYRKLQRVLASV